MLVKILVQSGAATRNGRDKPAKDTGDDGEQQAHYEAEKLVGDAPGYHVGQGTPIDYMTTLERLNRHG